MTRMAGPAADGGRPADVAGSGRARWSRSWPTRTARSAARSTPPAPVASPGSSSPRPRATSTRRRMPTVEDVAANWATINDETGYYVPADLMDWSASFLAHLPDRAERPLSPWTSRSPSPEQDLVELCRDFAQNEIAPRAPVAWEEARCPTDLLREMGELGLLGMLDPRGVGRDRHVDGRLRRRDGADRPGRPVGGRGLAGARHHRVVAAATCSATTRSASGGCGRWPRAGSWARSA